MELELERWERSRFLKNKVNQIFMVELSLPAGQRGSEIRPTFSTRARFCITILKKDLFFVGMSGLLVCLYAHVFLVPLEAKEGLRSSGIGVIDDCKPPYWFWEANLGSL